MKQLFNKHGGTILALLIVIAIDLHLTWIIKPHFDDTPTTKVWFCLAWMTIVTETGLGILWYHVKDNK
jgi:hypothetical protein